MEQPNSIGAFLKWITEPPQRSFTLFPKHLKLVRVARLTERVVFLGGAAMTGLAVLGGLVEWSSLLGRMIELKFTAIVLSQFAHVGTNVLRYALVPADREEMRRNSKVVFSRPAPYSPEPFDPKLHGFPSEPDRIKPGHIPTSTTVNVPSADHGTPRH